MSELPRAFVQPSHPARPDGLSFRLAGDVDLGFLCQVYADSRADELAPVQWPQAAKDAFLTQQFDAQHQHYAAHYQGADLLVVQWQGVPVGRIYVYRSASEIRLMDVIVLSGWRGRGLGRAMLAELLDEADRSPVPRRVSLHVEHNNPVRRLYSRLGFELVEDRGAYVFLTRTARETPVS